MSSNDSTDAFAARASNPRLFTVGTALKLHLFITTQIGIILTAWEAFVYCLLPFTLINLFVESTLRAPLFALLILTATVLSGIWTYRTLHDHFRKLRWWPRMLGGITLAMWIPVLAGEGIRLALVAPALASVPDRCHGQKSLLESLRATARTEGFKLPHAWKIQSGRAWLWSYRTLTFEPEDDWAGAGIAIERCNTTAR